MSLENEGKHGLNQQTETSHRLQKKLTISYTREFLLSLSDLDVCKKLPSGFDQSLLSESEDTSQDRFRISGSFSSQSFRRNEYGSSPPTRGDAGNYSRGVHGRWDSHSSGRSDRDSAAQSDIESDSGRRYGNQSRRPWQVTEHDGLLGSGSFPRPSGYVAGASASKFRANDHYQLSRSNEPYQPPRPYKAVPHSRRGANDSYNDETFGSSEYTSEDRAEEERKRRASFELMRKGQQKAFQENQKLNPGKRKDDIMELLEDSKDDKGLGRSNELNEQAIEPLLDKDLDKSTFTSPALVSRPLVPPGFSSTIVEKNVGTKSASQHHPSEAGNEVEGSLLHIEGECFVNRTSNKQEEKPFLQQTKLSEQPLGGEHIFEVVNSKSGKNLNLSSALDVSSGTIGVDDQFNKTSKLAETFETLKSDEMSELDVKDVTGNKVVGESSPAHSTSILDELFGRALTIDGSGSSSFIEHHDIKADETWSPHMVQSSKFAQWFLDDERKPNDDISIFSANPNDLLSLIVGEKSGSQDADVNANQHIPLKSPFKGSELGDRCMTSNFVSANIDNSEQITETNKPEAVPTVLTCEDLEQSILSEVTENFSTLATPVQCWSGFDAKSELKKNVIDDHASQHLLSMLQKGAGLKDIADSANHGSESSGKIQIDEVANCNTDVAHHNTRGVETENISNLGKPLTLETLFGTAFMKELQSIGAPATSQRSSVVSARDDVSESHGLIFPETDDGLLASSAEATSRISSHGNSGLAINQSQQMMLDRVEDHLLGFGARNKLDLSQRQTDMGSKFGGFLSSVDIQLPEDDSLIAVSNPLILQNGISAGISAKAELVSTPEASIDIAEKLAALNSVFRDERSITGGQEGPPFIRGRNDMKEPDFQYNNLHVQQSSSQVHPSLQLRHPAPMFHPLDSHPANINAQMKYMAPENIIHHDRLNHPFHAKMLRAPFHHLNTATSGFDPTTRSPVFQQMQMPENFPPLHVLNGFPRGAPVPNNHATNFMQQGPNPVQGFPFGQRQPNFGGPGIPLQASQVGSGTNHPEALQRLFEMELRSNSNQSHPSATAGHSRGMYGHELDMGFGFR